jgi:hypothetical protein
MDGWMDALNRNQTFSKQRDLVIQAGRCTGSSKRLLGEIKLSQPNYRKQHGRQAQLDGMLQSLANPSKSASVQFVYLFVCFT